MKPIETKTKQRRKLLKLAAVSGSIATGAGAGSLYADKWVKPVVNSILLPAHAQTTVGARFSFVGQDTTRLKQQNNGLMIATNAIDALIPQAQADSSIIIDEFYLEQLPNDRFRFMSLSTFTLDGDIARSDFYDTELTLGVPTEITGIICDNKIASTTATIISVVPGGIAMLNIFKNQYSLQSNPNAVPLFQVVCDEVVLPEL